MIVFPNCKINLGLRITRKRDDGYHDLETVFYPLPLHDVLEILHSSTGYHQFSISGFEIDGDSKNNLCLKAYELLKKEIPALPPAVIHLHKAIPAGAGLGGGSADAAYTLRLLNNKFSLGLSTAQLSDYALRLGSDCPFFIYNEPCYATGRGELLEPVRCDLSAYKILLINPGIHVNTGQAFRGIVPATPARSVKQIVAQPIDTWKTELLNDFEDNIFVQYPVIGQIKSKMYDAGAIYAAMSGTGSTVYGLFSAASKLPGDWPDHYFVRELDGQAQ